MQKIMRAMLLITLMNHQLFSSSDDVKSNLKISIIIPSSYKHAEFLYPLLKMYAKQTVLPYEVIISLSEIHKGSLSAIKKIQYARWPFRLKLLLSDHRQYAGTNRNIACECATGDIFVCQDADDIPHPQRVEIIKYFFEHYDIDHLMHLFKVGEEVEHFSMLHPEKIDFAYETDFEITLKGSLRFTNGCPAIRRTVFNKMQWPDGGQGEDIQFNRNAYGISSRCMVVQASLYVYRNELSTWHIGLRSQMPSNVYWNDLYDAFLLKYRHH